MNEVWSIFENYLFFIYHAYSVEIFAFVLMSNHFHMLVRAPKNNLSETMNYFMRETSRQIGRDAGRINQTYGSRHFKSEIRPVIYFLNAYKYLYRNPVEAGLSVEVESYKYSTLSILLGQQKSLIPLVDDQTLFQIWKGH